MANMNSDYDMLGLGYNHPVKPTESVKYVESFTSRKTNDEMRIDALRKEYQELKKQYSDLIQKTTILLEQYKKLEIEYNKLKSKKVKQDSVIKIVENLKNFFKNIWNSFIDWLST